VIGYLNHRPQGLTLGMAVIDLGLLFAMAQQLTDSFHQFST
jgi:hypothetical protein